MNVRLATLADFVEPVMTWNPRTKPDGIFSYIDLSAVDQNDKTINAAASIRGSDAPSRARQIVKKGDILVSTVRPNLNGVAAITEEFDGATASTGFCVLRPRTEKLSGRFLMHWVRSAQFVETMVRQATGASYPAVTDRIVMGSLIPLPPIEEQRRIAAILDKADALRRKRKRMRELIGSLTQSMFLEMFGSVVAAPPVNVRRNRPALPAKWQWTRLTDVARLATGHTPDRKQDSYWNGSIPWLSLGDIRALDGKIALSTAEYVTEAGIENSSSVLLPTGTVCFSRTASVGFATIMGRPMSTSQDFVNWVCGSSILAMYLLWALIAARRELLSLASGSTHRTIYFPTVEQFQVLLPPLFLQEKFAEAATKVTYQRAKLDMPSVTSDELFSSLQQRAFSGQL